MYLAEFHKLGKSQVALQKQSEKQNRFEWKKYPQGVNI